MLDVVIAKVYGGKETGFCEFHMRKVREVLTSVVLVYYCQHFAVSLVTTSPHQLFRGNETAKHIGRVGNQRPSFLAEQPLPRIRKHRKNVFSEQSRVYQFCHHNVHW